MKRPFDLTAKCSAHPQQLLAVCYALAAALWLVCCFVGSAVMLNHKMDGSMRTLTLSDTELSYESFANYHDLEWSEPPTTADNWYLSTDNDPHIFWQGTAYVETVRLDANHDLPAGSVALYYLLPGQTDYSERQKVFAHLAAPGHYTFDLGGKSVTGLRIDPDSVGGVPTQLEGVELNPESPWYLRFVPNGGQWLLLLLGPAMAAALLGLVLALPQKDD